MNIPDKNQTFPLPNDDRLCFLKNIVNNSQTMNPFLSLFLLIMCLSCSENVKAPTHAPLVADQLRYSYTDENWFVPVRMAINGLTPEQVNWTDSSGNHSIGELVSHLLFWNDMQIRAFKEEDFTDLDIDNDTTFTAFSEGEWEEVVSRLDQVQEELLTMVEGASAQQLSQWDEDLLSLASHNAYHAG